MSKSKKYLMMMTCIINLEKIRIKMKIKKISDNNNSNIFLIIFLKI